MAEQNSWKNQYIDLVGSKPEYIIPMAGADDCVAVQAELAARAAHFSGLVVELGSGSGGHLLDRAAAAPEILFVGFELRYKRVFRTAQKGEQRGLKNFLIVKGDARFMPKLFAPHSLNGVYVNFPDPWAKARWRKHRLLQTEFLQQVASLLKTGAFFSYRSDHEEYFNKTAALMSNVPQLHVEYLTHDFWKSTHACDPISSEFEKLFKGKGVAVHYLLMKKLGADLPG